MSARFEDFSVMGEGLEGLEGPVVLPDGSVLLVQVPLGLVTRVFPNGKTQDFNVGEGPSGLAMGPDGKVYIANSGQDHGGHKRPPGLLERAVQRVNMPKASQPGWTCGKIQRLDIETGKVETVYDGYGDGQKMWSPNDLCFDAAGGLWFTDHGRDTPTGRNYGGIFYCKPDGSHIERVDFYSPGPNGVGLSPDGKTLYLSDSFIGRLWAFDIVAPGKVGPPPPLMPARVVQTLAGYQILDSLKVEEGGKICVGTIIKGGITIFDPDGSTPEHVSFPQDLFITNLCFGGKDMRDIYCVGSSGNLYKGRWSRPGLKLNFNPY